MNENEKEIIAAESLSAKNNQGESAASEKKKRRFTIQSPYADYAADNDLCSEMMEKNEPAEKPDIKQLIKTALYALLTVLFFVGGTLLCSGIYSCLADSV